MIILNLSVGKLFRFLLAISLGGLLLGCASESRGPANESGSGGGSQCPAIGDLTVELVAVIGGGEACNVSGTLSVDATVPGDVNYVMIGSIEVGDTTNSPTLTFQSGAQILATEPGQYIYVAPAARIAINGSMDSPILLGAAASSNAFNSGWGGLIIEDVSSVSSEIRLRYLVVENGGAPVDRQGEQFSAAITLKGDHNNTQLQFVQTHNSVSDGIRLLNDGSVSGAVNVALLENILVTNSANDGIYFDQFSGLLKNIFVLHRQSPGRAGIRGGGNNSNPLIVSSTLIGNDGSSEAPPGNNEFAFLFDNGLTQVRIANTLAYAFRNGCYRVEGGADLSSAAIGSLTVGSQMTDATFIDGSHCVDPFGGGQSALAFGALSEILPVALRDNNVADPLDAGFNFYQGFESIFYGDTNSSAAFTASWYFLELPNGATPLASNGDASMRRYNDGDTDNSGTPDDVLDAAVNPLLGIEASTDAVYSGLEATLSPFLTCGFGDGLPDGFEWADSNGVALVPQPSANTYLCAPVVGGKSGFTLLNIGAIDGVSDTRFDTWTNSTGLERR